MGKVSWTTRASLHLQAIHDHIAPDSRFYAQRFVRGLIQATRKLEEHPRSGRVVPELPKHGFREVIDEPLDSEAAPNPWLDTFGRSADDPDFDDLVDEIERARGAEFG